MGEDVVRVQNLSRRFGKTLALDDLSLNLQPGLVYGLLGVNGAGKTTLIKHLLGLLRAQQGEVRVFGLDPVREPVKVLQRIGYLSEERDLPEWMRIDELLRYTRAFHPSWDKAYEQELLQLFRLDPSKKVKSLSKGMRAQAGLITAVAHRPELLVLDEPSTGLDAVVRKDILNALVRTVANEGRTAIFSSHLLDEVELMSDFVIIVNHGRLVLTGPLADIKASHRALTVKLHSAEVTLPSIDGVLGSEKLLAIREPDAMWRVICQGPHAPIQEAIQAVGGEVKEVGQASLQEIFIACVDRSQADATQGRLR
ncbi:ABC transporter ATP-binding protein [Aureliella helgolandensis]|uniref:Daunorubicin/doxorubicin resistance ATP-binding protein DrrA n=1 Tax=Aureliella helgolandensis TaxID=2527968 RepID=A0A518GGA1_9BACT|nr:ABC transporter ATP-binding protein [Aureliella helgolandensis]QDV27587.1 Daunorubicin/doxorubicin resistance ATP-binding protein DrrA [Aureliella helgolandensis]